MAKAAAAEVARRTSAASPKNKARDLARASWRDLTNKSSQEYKEILPCIAVLQKAREDRSEEDMEVLLQGHCVNEVVEYLREAYCIDKQWIELKLKESKKSNM